MPDPATESHLTTELDLPSERTTTAISCGVPIRDAAGQPAPAAAAAAALLDSVSSAAIDVYILPKQAPDRRRALYLLLRSAGRVRRDRCHLIGLDQLAPLANRTDSDEDRALTLALAAGLAAAARRYLQGRIQRRVDFSALDAVQYLHHVYGRDVEGATASGTMPEDEELIGWLVRTLPSFLTEGSLTRLAIPGWGPFSYLGLVLVPFLAPDAVADLSDPVDSNLRHAYRWHTGLLPAEDAAVGKKFERILVETAGARYAGCENQLKSCAQIRAGTLQELTPGGYDVVADSFVSSSISSSKQMFWESVRAKRRALRADPGVALVSLHKLGSRRWHQYPNGPEYPNVHLSAADVAQAYADADLDPTIFVTESHLDGRIGWDGMAAVIAKPATGERR